MCSKDMTASHSVVGLKIVSQIMEEMNQKRKTLSRSFTDLKRVDTVPPRPGHTVADASMGHAHAPARPFRRLRPTTSLPPEREAGHEILDILLSRANSGNFNSQNIGSPPCRAGNPLIHDAQFCQREALPSTNIFSCNTSSFYRGNCCAESSSSSLSNGANEFVRIEGFGTSQGESNQGMPAVA